MVAVWVSATHFDNAADDDHDTAANQALVAFVASLRIPDWYRDAACREHPAEWWFPTTGQNASAARSVCNRCLARSECAAASIDEPDGVWAGLTGRERRSLRTDAA